MRIAFFCKIESLFILKPHSKIQYLKCGKIKALYIVCSVYLGRTLFNVLIIQIIRDTLFEILSMWWDQSKVSAMVVPKKLKSLTLSLSLSVCDGRLFLVLIQCSRRCVVENETAYT